MNGVKYVLCVALLVLIGCRAPIEIIKQYIQNQRK
jgi:hypothetical protein